MECNTSIALNLKYPNMFAALLLIVRPWDTKTISELTKVNMQIINSEGDDKSYAGIANRDLIVTQVKS